MSDLHYRKLEASDYDRVMFFWASVDGIHLHNDRSETLEGFTAVLERNPGLSTIAIDGSTVVAACLCTHDGRRGWISHLAVAEAYRGRGIGRRLVEKARDDFEELGIDTLAVGILKEGMAARAFWTHMGFSKLEVADIYIAQNG